MLEAPATATMRQIMTILLATDVTSASSAATDQAIDLAVRLDARLLVVTVLESGRSTGSLRGVRPETRSARTRLAQGVVNAARAEGADASFLVWEGDAGGGIIAAAEAEDVDLIVVGSHGRRGVGRFILGSVSDHVVHNARCPVLVVRPVDDDASDRDEAED